MNTSRHANVLPTNDLFGFQRTMVHRNNLEFSTTTELWKIVSPQEQPSASATLRRHEYRVALNINAKVHVKVRLTGHFPSGLIK